MQNIQHIFMNISQIFTQYYLLNLSQNSGSLQQVQRIQLANFATCFALAKTLLLKFFCMVKIGLFQGKKEQRCGKKGILFFPSLISEIIVEYFSSDGD